jgi:hypothetical protein
MHYTNFSIDSAFGFRPHIKMRTQKMYYFSDPNSGRQLSLLSVSHESIRL